MSLARLVFGLGLAALPGIAVAEDPAGCGGFKWPLERERALLTAPNVPPIASGSDIADGGATPVEITLLPFADAKLPSPPERAPKSPTAYAGFVRIAGITKPGTYNVTLSAEAWIDVIQDGRFIKSTTFSGAVGCAGLRKSVKFDLAAAPVVVQLSGVSTGSIRVIVSPATN